MTYDDRRDGDRQPVSMRIKLKYPDVQSFIERYSSNISRGGIFVQTRRPRPIGTVLRFEFLLSDQTRLIRGEGRVAWVRERDEGGEPAGMGVKYTRLDRQSRELIERALSYREQLAAAVGQAPQDEPAWASTPLDQPPHVYDGAPVPPLGVGVNPYAENGPYGDAGSAEFNVGGASGDMATPYVAPPSEGPRAGAGGYAGDGQEGAEPPAPPSPFADEPAPFGRPAFGEGDEAGDAGERTMVPDAAQEADGAGLGDRTVVGIDALPPRAPSPVTADADIDLELEAAFAGITTGSEAPDDVPVMLQPGEDDLSFAAPALEVPAADGDAAAGLDGDSNIAMQLPAGAAPSEAASDAIALDGDDLIEDFEIPAAEAAVTLRADAGSPEAEAIARALETHDEEQEDTTTAPSAEAPAARPGGWTQPAAEPSAEVRTGPETAWAGPAERGDAALVPPAGPADEEDEWRAARARAERRAREEEDRLRAEAVERQVQAEVERRARDAEEEERLRSEAEERDEARRRARAEDERRMTAEQEQLRAQRRARQEEERRARDEVEQRLAAEEEERRRQEDERRAARWAREEEQRRGQEERRVALEAEEQRLREEEEHRVREEEERRAGRDEARRRAAREEDERRAAREEAERLAAREQAARDAARRAELAGLRTATVGSAPVALAGLEDFDAQLAALAGGLDDVRVAAAAARARALLGDRPLERLDALLQELSRPAPVAPAMAPAEALAYLRALRGAPPAP
jgi:uncharacterized protein (TIGR02266 family)